VAKAFADETFGDIKDAVKDLVNEYKSMKILEKFNDTQLYSYVILTMTENIYPNADEFDGIRNYEDTPERPNGGKWFLTGNKAPIGYKNELINKFHVSGRYSHSNPCDGLSLIEEWSTDFGKTHNAVYTYHLSEGERTTILYKIYTKQDLTEIQMEFIPDLVRLGFISDENGEKKVCVPIISYDDYYNALNKMREEKYKQFRDKLKGKIIDTMKKNVIKYPKQIKDIANQVYTSCLAGLAPAYIYKAAEEGLIEMKEGTNYPVMIMVEDKK
jgi:hypothetical protein